MFHSKISGLGYYVPDNIVTNDDLAKKMDTNDEWIQERTGIKERRHVNSPEDTTTSMGVKMTPSAWLNAVVPLVANLPLRWRFYRSGLYISPLAPLILGVAVGILTMLMGVGGGFILVPAMLYILGMSAGVVVGTSLFNILFVTMVTTMMHALTTKAVDIVLAGLLLLGSVSGAQIGTQLAQKARPEALRLVLAGIVLLVALRMLFGLGVRPDEIYTVSPL